MRKNEIFVMIDSLFGQKLSIGKINIIVVFISAQLQSCGKIMSCQSGAPSLTSMSTPTVIANLSSFRAFPVQEPKYSTRGQSSQQAVKLKKYA